LTYELERQEAPFPLQKKPENEPIPHPSPEDPGLRVPGKNCLKAAQIVA
jgi:hypothetical protein